MEKLGGGRETKCFSRAFWKGSVSKADLNCPLF